MRHPPERADGSTLLLTLREELSRARSMELAHIRENLLVGSGTFEATPADELDFARSLGEGELCANLKERHSGRLAEIEEALTLMRDGRYGVCRQCGEEIPVERLKAMPYTSYCRDCKEGLETTEARNAASRLSAIDNSLSEDPGEPAEDSDKEEIEPPHPAIRRRGARREVKSSRKREATRSAHGGHGRNGVRT